MTCLRNKFISKKS